MSFELKEAYRHSMLTQGYSLDEFETEWQSFQSRQSKISNAIITLRCPDCKAPIADRYLMGSNQVTLICMSRRCKFEAGVSLEHMLKQRQN